MLRDSHPWDSPILSLVARHRCTRRSSDDAQSSSCVHGVSRSGKSWTGGKAVSIPYLHGWYGGRSIPPHLLHQRESWLFCMSVPRTRW